MLSVNFSEKRSCERYSIHSGDGGMVAHERSCLQEQARILFSLEGVLNEGYYIQDNIDHNYVYIAQDEELKKVVTTSKSFIDHKSKHKLKIIK